MVCSPVGCVASKVLDANCGALGSVKLDGRWVVPSEYGAAWCVMKAPWHKVGVQTHDTGKPQNCICGIISIELILFHIYYWVLSLKKNILSGSEVAAKT